MLLEAPVPAARGSAARPRAAPAPPQGCRGAADLQPSDISPERGLVYFFFKKTVYYRFHNQ